MARPKVEVTQNMRDKLIYYYSKKNFVLDEICNLLGISKTLVSQICKEEFKKGTLTPRKSSALKNRLPNGQGKKYQPTGVGSGGRNCERKKFTAEQEQQIIVDYYENNLNWSELREKWGINGGTMKVLRDKAEPIYGKKKYTRKKQEINNENI